MINGTRGWAIAALVVVVAAGVGVGLARRDHDVTVSRTACGGGWAGPVVGRSTITLRDISPDTAQVYLIDPAGTGVYAEVRDLTPGGRRAMSTTLGTGRYALRCVFSNGVVRTSTAHALSQRVVGALPAVPAMPDLDLEPAVDAYRSYLAGALPGLWAATARLAADVRSGDLGRARADWLPAHLDYEQLGAAYNSFGDFDAAINGTADGLPAGVDDPSWTGFFRVEYALWHGQSAATVKPLTDRLLADVDGLVADFPTEDIDPADLPLRSHEILENTLRFQLGGADDYGSGTTLATAYANTTGTAAVLATIAPLIAVRQPALLAAADQGLATVRADLLADRDATGSWIPAGTLSRPRHQRLDADLDALLEQLAAIPNLLQERNSA
jgi:iron uptake system EfeUOB component EfeO/EfeM